MKSLIVYENNDSCLDKVNGVIMPLANFSVSYLYKYTIDEIKDFVMCHKDMKVFVVINKNIFNDEITSLENILRQLDSIGITGVFYYDLSVLSIYRKNNFSFELIWNQTHMVTNYNTINYYLGKGINGAVISNEITLDEILEIRKKTEAKLFVNVVYCPIMSFSRRKLLSNYCKSSDIEINGNMLEVSEHSTGYNIIVLEEDDGTSLFSKKIVNNLDILEKYNEEDFDYAIIDLSFIEDLEIKRQIIATVYSVLNNLENQEELVKNMKEKIGSNSGFLYRKTIYKVK